MFGNTAEGLTFTVGRLKGAARVCIYPRFRICAWGLSFRVYVEYRELLATVISLVECRWFLVPQSIILGSLDP